MRPSLASLLAALVLVAGCADMGAGVTDLSDQAGDAAERTRFCLAAARTLSAVEEGTATTSGVQAAEETLAQAPDGLRGDARVIVEFLRRALDGDPAAMTDHRFHETVDRFRDDVRDACTPT
jgi:hypothetical protein